MGRGLPKEGGGTESTNEQQRKREGEGGKGKDGEGPRAGPIAMRGTTTKEQREMPTDLLLTMCSEINNAVRVCAQHYVVV